MTTVDIRQANGNTLAAVNQADDNLARLAQWVEAARNAHQLVAPLVDTAFVPEAYKPKLDPRASDEQKTAARALAVANATAAVLQGISLGIDPLTSLQQIYIVHGRPGMYAKMMVALVQAHGHEVWTDEQTDTRAVVAGRRAGSEHIERVTVTMDQARKAGWTSNQAYTKTPQDMLWARAAARVCDRIASDVLKGIASVEQIRDEIRVDAEVGQAVRTVTPRRRPADVVAAIAAAEPRVVAQEEPPLDETPAGHGDPAPDTRRPTTDHTATLPEAHGDPEPVIDLGDAPVMASPEQRAKLSALLRDTGRPGQSRARIYIAGIINREVSGAQDLTADEAAQVIEALESELSATQSDDSDLELPL